MKFFQNISLFSMKSIKKYGANTVWVFIEFFIKLLSVSVVAFLLPNYLSVEDFGIFSYVVSIVFVFKAFEDLGSNSILMKKLVQNKTEDKILLGSAFILRTIGCFTVVTLCVLYWLILQKNAPFILLITIAFGYIVKPLFVIDFYFKSKIKSFKSMIAGIISQLFFFGSFLILFYYSKELVYFGIPYLIEAIIFAIILICYYLKEQPVIDWQPKKRVIKKMFLDSYPILILGINITIYMRIDQLMITNILGGYENGQYSVAAKISEFWLIIPMAVVISLFPVIVKMKEGKDANYYLNLKRLYILIIAISIIFATLISLFGDVFLKLLYNDKYMKATGSLMILSWTGLIISIGLVTTRWIVAEGLQKNLILGSILAVVTNMFLNYIFIPIYGIESAAYITLLSYAIAVSSYIFAFKKSRLIFFKIIKS